MQKETLMKKTSMIVPVLFSCVILLAPLFAEEKTIRWRVGEELTYKVKWSFVRLGTLRAVISDTLRMNNEKVYHIHMFVDSNPTLFFVSHHAVYETYFTDDMKVLLFKGNEKIDGIKYDGEYRYDYSDSLVHCIFTNEKEPSRQIQRTIRFHGRIFDGASLLYYARANVGYSKIDTLHYIDDGKDELAILQFMGSKGSIKIRAHDKSIKSSYLVGRILGNGIAGLHGEFEGWFAEEMPSPPLIAKMKVFIGSVIVELESWKGWKPTQD